jgi:hypothetical protein
MKLDIDEKTRHAMDDIANPLASYAVELNFKKERKPTEPPKFIGSGVLVSRMGRFGILTAYHCLHSAEHQVQLERGHTLYLGLHRERSGPVRPDDVQAVGCVLEGIHLREHKLAKPGPQEEFGPDLTFIEIFPHKVGALAGSGWIFPKTTAEWQISTLRHTDDS